MALPVVVIISKANKQFKNLMDCNGGLIVKVYYYQLSISL